MIEALFVILILVIIVGGIAFLAVRRGLQMRELCDHGVETSGVITSKRQLSHGQRQMKLAYEYMDANGATHSHTSVVTKAAYEEHDEGGPIRVVYSSKRPEVSAPLYLVEQCRKALGR